MNRNYKNYMIFNVSKEYLVSPLQAEQLQILTGIQPLLFEQMEEEMATY